MSKTALRVVSTILLIVGVLSLVIEAALLAGLHESTALSILVICYMLGGLFDILAGFFGLKAVKDASRKTPALVLGTLSFLSGLATIFLSFSVKSVCAFVIPLIYFICVLRLGKDE